MKQIKSKKGQQGFTLVEVIVVAIIVAALAAVAVPMYTSYVASSRTNAAANAAGSVASFMGSCINQSGTVSEAAAVGGGDDEEEGGGGGGGGDGAIDTDGLTAVSLECKTVAGGDEPVSKLQLPKDIKFSITKVATNGSVTATHLAGGDPQSYSY